MISFYILLLLKHKGLSDTTAVPLDKTHLDAVKGDDLTKRFQPSASTRRARRSNAATYDKDK